MMWFDWVLVVIVALSTGISLLRGFVKEALALAGWILAFFVAKFFYLDLAEILINTIETPSIRKSVAWVALFLLVLIVAGAVNFLIGKILKHAGLTGTDRLFGMFFGCIRGILLCTLLIIALKSFTSVHEDPWWTESELIPHVEVVAEWSYKHLKEIAPDVMVKLDSIIDI